MKNKQKQTNKIAYAFWRHELQSTTEWFDNDFAFDVEFEQIGTPIVCSSQLAV